MHERALEFASEVVGAVEFLHRLGPVGRALSYQILDAGTSVGAKRIIASIINKTLRSNSP